MVNNVYNISSFLNQGAIELRRAERYRVFVALILFDFTSVKEQLGARMDEVFDNMVRVAQESVRGSDLISRVNGSIAVLIPETPRQGAEVTSQRLGELFRAKISELVGQDYDPSISTEIASFPDTAGARTLPEFLDELSRYGQN